MNGSRKFLFFLTLMLVISLCMNLYAAAQVRKLADKTERIEKTLDQASLDLLDMARVIRSLPSPASEDRAP